MTVPDPLSEARDQAWPRDAGSGEPAPTEGSGPRRVPWPAGAATGVGSLPGTDVREAVRVVRGELPDFPHLPELPARGPGADLLGRTAAALTGLHVDLQPAGWRLVPRPGRDERRAGALLREDLDALEEGLDGYQGPVKVQLAGPWTLAAGLELPRGGRVLADQGAVRDLGDSLTETLTAHVGEISRRVPGGQVVLQLDEPALPAVLAARLTTASGFGRLPAVDEAAAEQRLRAAVDAAATVGALVVAHCCAADPPVALFVRAGVAAVSLDATLLGVDRATPWDDVLGEVVEAGVSIWAGIVPAVPPSASEQTEQIRLSDPAATVEPMRRLWHRLGHDPAALADAVVVTPTCGLAGADPGYARAAMALARRAARTLVDAPEG